MAVVVVKGEEGDGEEDEEDEEWRGNKRQEQAKQQHVQK